MQTFSNIFFWMYACLFLISITIAFYIPGSVCTKSLKIDTLSKSIVNFLLGISLWGISGFIAGLLNIRWILYGYILFFALFYFRQWSLTTAKSSARTLIRSLVKYPVAVIIIAVGTVTQMILSWLNGITINEGVYFCCNLNDSISHLSISSELVSHFPPIDPGASHVLLVNFHFLTNLVIADISRIFIIPVLYVHYLFFSPFINLLIGFSAMAFALQLSFKSKNYMYWLMFFLYFSGDIIYLFFIFSGKGLQLAPWFLHHSGNLWFSPSRVFALILLYGMLTFCVVWMRKKAILSGMFAAIIAASLVGFKIYTAFFAFVGLFLLTLYLIPQRGLKNTMPFLVMAIIGTVLYLPFNSGAGGLIFTGFWRVEDYIVQPYFGFSHFYLAKEVYAQHKNWLKVVFYEAGFFLFYFVTIFGSLNLAFFQTKKSLQNMPVFVHILIIPGIVACLSLGFFFIQKTGGANSSQFIISVMTILPIYAALALDFWSEKLKKRIKYLVIAVICVITSVRIFYTASLVLNNIIQKKGLIVSHQELQAIRYLQINMKHDDELIPDTRSGCSYISFFLKKPLYLCEDSGPNVRGLADYDKRLALFNSLFIQQTDGISLSNTFSSGSMYVYSLRKNSNLTTHPFYATSLEPVFVNQDVVIYHIKQPPQ